ncbi:MAG TPA: uracil phosphoribosyltransferase [Chloroflexia bacterium]|nr:uracil phosphoribosyltransferase [Chloroflexia bacterium]
MAQVYCSNHPLIQHKLAKLRSVDTDPKQFREIVAEITVLLTYEATHDLHTTAAEIVTPLTTTTCRVVNERVGLVPVLRAGLGMVEAVLGLLPYAQVWHIGLFRDEQTLKPISYYNRLPDHTTVDTCLLLDPMLATGGSASATVDILKKWGATRIKYLGLIAAPEGIAQLSKHHPDVPMHIAAVDSHLNERGYIVPGLGDAGDRQFGTG